MMVLKEGGKKKMPDFRSASNGLKVETLTIYFTWGNSDNLPTQRVPVDILT
jgi:hypothetical protein